MPIRTLVNRYISSVSGMIVLLLAVLLATYGIRHDTDIINIVDEFYSNASTELFSIGVTVLVIDALGRLRAREEEKRRLILQMGSPDNALAVEAARILRLEGWLTNGGLRGADLQQANLASANLTEANLAGAQLRWANLAEANVTVANLTGVDLRRADLSNADVRGTNLTGADMDGATLRGTNFFGANLTGVNLYRAELVGAHFGGADLGEQITLPDGTAWTPGVFTMSRFTDPDHPQFWDTNRPD